MHTRCIHKTAKNRRRPNILLAFKHLLHPPSSILFLSFSLAVPSCTFEWVSAFRAHFRVWSKQMFAHSLLCWFFFFFILCMHTKWLFHAIFMQFKHCEKLGHDKIIKCVRHAHLWTKKEKQKKWKVLHDEKFYYEICVMKHSHVSIIEHLFSTVSYCFVSISSISSSSSEENYIKNTKHRSKQPRALLSQKLYKNNGNQKPHKKNF